MSIFAFTDHKKELQLTNNVGRICFRFVVLSYQSLKILTVCDNILKLISFFLGTRFPKELDQTSKSLATCKSTSAIHANKVDSSAKKRRSGSEPFATMCQI